MVKTILMALLSLLLASAVQAAELKLSWTDNSDNEDGFNIYRRKAPSGSTMTKIASVGANVSETTDITVTEGVIYCYEVTAFNSVGESEPSNEECAQVKIALPKPPDGPVALGFKLNLECSMKRLADGSLKINCPAP